MSKILRLRLPKRSATNILQKWVLQGNPVTLSQLQDISKELRRSQRKVVQLLFVLSYHAVCIRFVWLIVGVVH
ncbi:hypothetical protein VIGAN_09111800 [Vigna angularis var. angularis]|nr:hypothetical protein VIGAN_09111800 [Vigna angularis var. angularis]